MALFEDRLEVTSPGMLLNNVTISKMMEGYSKPRNPAIARAFAYMKSIEKWGTGIPRLVEACKEYGLPKLESLAEDPNITQKEMAATFWSIKNEMLTTRYCACSSESLQ